MSRQVCEHGTLIDEPCPMCDSDAPLSRENSKTNFGLTHFCQSCVEKDAEIKKLLGYIAQLQHACDVEDPVVREALRDMVGATYKSVGCGGDSCGHEQH